MLRVHAELNPGIARLEELLALPKEAAEDALVAVDEEFRKHEKRVFDTEGSEGGEKWAPLSPAYKARKDRIFSGARAEIRRIAKARGQKVGSYARRLGAQNRILQLTGDGKRAFSEAGGFHVAEAVKRASGWFLILGAAGPKYMEYHATGDGQKLRPPIQVLPTQYARFVARSNRALIPHILRRVRLVMAWRRAQKTA